MQSNQCMSLHSDKKCIEMFELAIECIGARPSAEKRLTSKGAIEIGKKECDGNVSCHDFFLHRVYLDTRNITQ